MNMFRNTLTTTFAVVPLLSWPAPAFGQSQENSSAAQAQSTATTTARKLHYRSLPQTYPNTPYHSKWTLALTNPYAGRSRSYDYMLHGANIAADGTRAEYRTVTRYPTPTSQRSYADLRWLSAEPSRSYYPRARYPLGPSRSPVSFDPVARFGKIGAGLAALFGFGAWGVSSGRKES